MKIDREASLSSGLTMGPTASSQTLVRGLDVLEQVSEGPVPLALLAERLKLSRSTVHRLATTLLERRYLNVAPRRGYTLGPKLLELGTQAREQLNLVRLAQPAMALLAERTGEVALLGVRYGTEMLLADRLGGRRALAPTIRPGERQALATCALGQALLLDDAPDHLAALPQARAELPALLAAARAQGLVVDDACNDAEIAAVAAPVRDADGAIRAAVAVSAARAYFDERARARAIDAVRHAALTISAELGWPLGSIGQPEPAEQNLLNSAAISSPPICTAPDAVPAPPAAADPAPPDREVKRFAMKGRKA